jgi:hypothetical protein
MASFPSGSKPVVLSRRVAYPELPDQPKIKLVLKLKSPPRKFRGGLFFDAIFV